MKYTITYKCGHQSQIELFGSEKERDQKIVWLANQNCNACKNEVLQQEVEKFSLPKIDGSEKQIAWALKIRSEMALKVKNEIKLLSENKDKMEQIKVLVNENKDKYASYYKAINVLENTSANWFIENRF